MLALASELLQHWRMPNTGEAFPLTNDEVRRRRLLQLVSITPGGLAAIAKGGEVCSVQNLDHILKRRRQTARKDGSQPLVMMGDKLARDIEQAMGLAPGWMDWPFFNVDYEAFATLGVTGRAVVEGRMIAAVEDALKLPAIMQSADRKPVTDQTVESHLPQLSQQEVKSAHAKAERRSRMAVVDPADPRLKQRPLLPEA